jgi:hypothetical protein
VCWGRVGVCVFIGITEVGESACCKEHLQIGMRLYPACVLQNLQNLPAMSVSQAGRVQ